MGLLAQQLCWIAAFWLALACSGAGAARRRGRFIAGLALGALAARAASCLLAGGCEATAWLAPRGGASLLALPLGLAMAALGLPRGEGAAALDRFLAALPWPLALARLGCLAAGCCGAGQAAGPLPWSPPALEAGAFALLGLGSPRQRGARLLVGGAALRHATTPWRPESSPVLVAAAASLWLLAGSWLAASSLGKSPPASRSRGWLR